MTIYSSLRAQNRKKNLQKSFWESAKKVPENTRKSQKLPPKKMFDFFGYFRGLFCRPQKDSFGDFFAILGPEGPETLVNGRSGCKAGLSFTSSEYALDGRNRAIVIAELLARVIAAIRITSVRWWSYISLKNKSS